MGEKNIIESILNSSCNTTNFGISQGLSIPSEGTVFKQL
jgi:hypothetical protein